MFFILLLDFKIRGPITGKIVLYSGIVFTRFFRKQRNEEDFMCLGVFVIVRFILLISALSRFLIM